MSEQDADVARRVAERIQGDLSSGFAATCGLRVTSAAAGRARVELPVTPAVANPNGHLHGGAIASLVDHAGTLAIMTADRQGRPGVTTDLNTTYLAPASLGDTVVADADVLRVGRTMAYVTVDVRRPDGTLIAQGRMSKFQGA